MAHQTPAGRPAMSERVYAGATGAQRREQRRRRLLDAAADVIRAEGLAGTSYRAVCRRARLTERYFYESFANVDDLLLAVVDEQLERGSQLVLAAVARAEKTPRATAHAAIECFVDQVAEDPLLGRLLTEAASHRTLRDARRRALTLFTEMMVHTSVELTGSRGSARAQRRARHVALTLAGGLGEIVTQWLDGVIPRTSRDEIVDDAADLFAAAVEQLANVTPTTTRGRD